MTAKMTIRVQAVLSQGTPQFDLWKALKDTGMSDGAAIAHLLTIAEKCATMKATEGLTNGLS